MQVANTFDTDKLRDLLGKTGKLAIDKMAFGAIELDASGKILSYNKAEGDITGRDPKAQVGKRFFDEVAPCTKHPDFHGRFLQLVSGAIPNAKFDFVFDYQMRPTKVQILMSKSLVKKNDAHTYWVFVKRI